MTSQQISESIVDAVPEWLVDQYLGELRGGRDPSIADYAAKIPEFSDRITQYLNLLRFSDGRRDAVPASTPAATPETIGDLTIEGLIGSGGMGVVYVASHPKLKRQVAVKVLHPERAANPEVRERFVCEAEIASRLTHSNIVTLFDFGEDENYTFLSIQYIDGQSLSELLDSFTDSCAETDEEDNETEVPPVSFIAGDFRRTAKLGADVASALTHAHERGTIHRDIKPGNLILDREDKTWVTDFGLARIREETDDLSRSGDLISTPRYMAPEQVRNVADARSDIYSLGVTLWEMVTGRKAWLSVSPENVVMAKSSGVELADPRELNPGVPQGLAPIISRAFAWHPNV